MIETESIVESRSKNGWTIGYIILRHLFHEDRRNQDDMLAPFEVSQPGIARAAGISRAHAAIELKRLAEKRYVAESGLRHIPGEPIRRKTYRITRAGVVRLVEFEGGETCEHNVNLMAPRTRNT